MLFFFFQAEDGIRDRLVTGVQTCALPISGYDIRETTKIWERMKEAKKEKEPPEFMSTHPSSDNRIKKITEWMNEVIVEYPPIKQAE